MERLTSRNEDCVLVNGHGLYHLTMTEVVQMADRLAAYEDTGREPEEVTALGKLFNYALKESKTLTEQLTLLHHIRELAEADKDERVVVLPCKVGDKLYRVFAGEIFEHRFSHPRRSREGFAGNGGQAMTRKRARKILMSIGTSRNHANWGLTAKPRWKTNAGVVEDTLTIALYAKLMRKKMDEGKITEESAIRAGAMAASELWLKEVNHA